MERSLGIGKDGLFVKDSIWKGPIKSSALFRVDSSCLNGDVVVALISVVFPRDSGHPMNAAFSNIGLRDFSLVALNEKDLTPKDFFVKKPHPWETSEMAAQMREAEGHLEAAKQWRKAAQKEFNPLLLTEEKAVEEGKIVRKDLILSLGKADQLCWTVRNLREFNMYQDMMNKFYYWE